MLRWMLLLLSCWGLFGCSGLFRSVDVEATHSSVQAPSNVAVYARVTDRQKAVTELETSSFRVFENDAPVDPEQARLTLLDRDLVAEHHTVLLVDMSGNLGEQTRKDIIRGVANFVQKVRQTQAVTVYAFDGADSLAKIGEFQRETESPSTPELAALENFRARDASRNLNGAVARALTALDSQLMRIRKPVRVGTLVVLAFGPDVAGRVTGEALWQLVHKAPHTVFAVGVESGKEYYLDELGHDGVVRAPSAASIPVALEETAYKVRDAYQSYYLVQYCSPGRAGVRRMRMDVHFTTREGEERKGSLALDFDASGFGPGCDPKTPPTFVKAAREPGEFERDSDGLGDPNEPGISSTPSSSKAPSDGGPSSEAPADAGASVPENPAQSEPPAAPPAGEAGDDAVVPPPDGTRYQD